MKTYQLNKTVGVVEVQNGSTEFCITHNAMWYSLSYRVPNTRHKPFGWTHRPLDGEGWQFLSLASDMTEEGAKQAGFDNLESLRSWEIANGYVTVNPLGNEMPKSVTYSYDKFNSGERLQNRWKQAQQQVVNIAYLIKG